MSALIVVLMSVYVAGFIVAWVYGARQWFRDFPITAEPLEAGCWGFLAALFWPLWIPAMAVGFLGKRLA